MADRHDATMQEAMAEPAAQESGAAESARSCGVELAFLTFIFLLVLSFAWQLWSLSAFQQGSVGPGFYPLCLTIILSTLVLIRALRVAVKMQKTRKSQEFGATEPGGTVTRDQLLLVALVVAGALVGVWSSLLVAIGLFLVVGLLSVERIGLRRAFTFAAGALFFVYLVFDLWLGMDVGLKGLF